MQAKESVRRFRVKPEENCEVVFPSAFIQFGACAMKTEIEGNSIELIPPSRLTFPFNPVNRCKHAPPHIHVCYMLNLLALGQPMSTPELYMGWVDPRIGLGWVGLGREWVENLCF